MSPSSPLRRLGPLALLAATLSLGAGLPALAQSSDRYERPPSGSDRNYDADDPDGDAPAPGGDRNWRDDNRYDDRDARDDRRYDARDADDDDRPPAPGGRDTSFDAFYEDLEQYGRWQEHPRYGDIWIPGDSDPDWRPYTRGSWTFTEEYGWYWTSSEPWGWATYHYGRWSFDRRHGWFWVPGREWAPAWVTWRYGDDFVGWAPLPPEGHGFRYDEDYLTSARFAPAWIFVAPGFLLAQGLHRHALPASRNSRALSVTRLAATGGGGGRGAARAAVRGIDVRTVERLTRTTVTPSRVAVTDNRRDPGLLRPRDGSITIFSPQAIPRGGRGPGLRSSPPPGAAPGAAPGEPPRRQAAPGAPPSASPPSGTPGGFDRRRGVPPPAGTPAASPPSTSPAASSGPAPVPAARAPAPPAPSPSSTPPPPTAREPGPDGQRRSFPGRDANRPPPSPPAPAASTPPPPPPGPPPSVGTPVQPRILNQAPPQAAAPPPPPRPAPPQAAAPPPPRPAPPAAAAQGSAPPKDHKQHEHKKKPDEPPPPPPTK